ncbi:calcium/sodium antiporter [Roseospirillum parvum]|uniref:Cation:H+ antiporter n=1 Tax=Roseospirillum parvum TaxID=83401 RepID=A0A1G7V7R0_9PROT|nr:calcium/sodium antiporter [Roseospirillum parvum]SDG55628.1 cation:H+ antiporter [Roseospirillum parvum]
MDAILPYVMFVAGLILLPVGAEVLVRGSVALAERLGISPLVVGLTVVAFGTSAPELVVSLNAALSGVPAIAIGNVVGSNIANILLILGCAALLKPVHAEPRSFLRDAGIMVLVTLLAIGAMSSGAVPRWQGIVMLVLLLAFILFSYWQGRRDTAAAEAHLHEVEELEGLKQRPLWMIAGAVLVGLAAVVWGADLLVDGAVVIALGFGIPEEVIGLSMIAIGTSLPELATVVAAARKGHTDIAVGNVLGSNIFNILAILGTTAVVVPVPVPAQVMAFDVWVMLASAVLVIPLMLTGRNLGRLEGGGLLLAYGAYITLLYVGVDKVIG